MAGKQAADCYSQLLPVVGKERSATRQNGKRKTKSQIGSNTTHAITQRVRDETKQRQSVGMGDFGNGIEKEGQKAKEYGKKFQRLSNNQS